MKSSKISFFLFLVSLASTYAFADQAKNYTKLDEQHKKMVEEFENSGKAEELRKKYKQIEDAANSDKELVERVSRISESHKQQLMQSFSENPVNKKLQTISKNGNVTYLFLSYSMGEKSLKEALWYLSQNNSNTVGVIRGFPEVEGKGNKDQTASLKKVHALLKDLSQMPNLILDPNLFDEFNVKSVPYLVLTTAQTDKGYPLVRRKAIIEVLGGIDPSIVDEMLAQDRKGKQPQIGRAFDIEEEHAIQSFKTTASNVDWEYVAKKSVDVRYDHLYEISDEIIPRALKNATVPLDMRYRLQQDIPDGRGGIAYKKGLLINPLDYRTSYNYYIFFDPNDRMQTIKVKELLSNTSRKVILFMTRMIDIEESKRSESLKDKLEEYRKDLIKGTSAQTSLFLMTPDVKDRFKVTEVPALVYQEGKQMKKTTYAVVGE